MSWKDIRQFFVKYRPYIIGGILCVAALYSIFNRLTGRKSPATPTPSAISSATFSPTPSSALASPSASPGISTNTTQISTAASFFPSLFDNHLYFFDFTGARIAKVSLSDQQITELAEGSDFIEAAAWSPDHTQVLLRAINGQGSKVENPFFQANQSYGEKTTLLYNLRDQTIKPLNDGIVAFAWLSDSRIVYQYQSGVFNNLSLAKPDGSGWKNIAQLKGKAAITPIGSDILVQIEGQSTLSRYSVTGEVIENITIPADFKLSRSSWSSDGSQALYTTFESNVLAIKRYSKGSTDASLVINYPTAQEDLAILWDNKNSDVYLASFEGLVKLGVKVGSQ